MDVGLVIEEITEEAENVPSGNNKSSSSEQTEVQPRKSGGSSNIFSTANNRYPETNAESLDKLKNDPVAMR